MRARGLCPADRWQKTETLEESVRRHLAAKVDVRDLSHLEQLETLSEPGRNPAGRELATAYLGLVPAGVDPQIPDRHALASGRRPAGARVRPRDDPPHRARSPPREALVHEPRLRARAADLHARRAPRHLRRGARPSRHRDEPPARPPAPAADRGHRRAAALRERGRPAGGDLPLPQSRARDHGSVRRPASAYNERLVGRQDSELQPQRLRRTEGGRTLARRSRFSSGSLP